MKLVENNGSFLGDAACSPYRTWQTIYKHQPWRTMTKTQTKQVRVHGNIFSSRFNHIHFFVDTWRWSMLMDGAGWRKHPRCTIVASLSGTWWTPLDWSQQWKRICSLEGNIQALFNLSQSISAIRNQSGTNLSEVLCPKSRRMRMTFGDILI